MKSNFKTNITLNPKNILLTLLIIGAMCLFIFYPFSCTDLHFKIYFSKDSAYTECTAYYTTVQDPVFSDAQRITATTTEGMADILFPKDFCENLTGLRLDFTQTDNLIRIDRIELCSAGFIQRSLNASEFLTESAMLAVHDISAVQPVMHTVYIKTDGSDPYIYFTSDTVQFFNDAFSHYTGSKLAICLFFILTAVLARKNLFKAG